MCDWFDKIMNLFFVLIVILCFALIIITGFGIYFNVKAEKITLVKDHWHCSETIEKKRIMMAGKVPVTNNYEECVKYVRVK